MQSCNLFYSNKNVEEFYYEKMLFKWKAELIVNSPFFLLNNPRNNNAEFDFNELLEDDAYFFLFIPSSACYSCFNNLYEYIDKELNLNDKDIIIVCDESNIRQTLFVFPNNIVLSMKSLDKIEVMGDNNYFISPFMFTYKSGKMFGSFILEKNRNDLVKSYIDFWLMSN